MIQQYDADMAREETLKNIDNTDNIMQIINNEIIEACKTGFFFVKIIFNKSFQKTYKIAVINEETVSKVIDQLRQLHFDVRTSYNCEGTTLNISWEPLVLK